ncbi:PD-(D/E)XK nuclease family transposase [bacterium]|nr:PD-(D/E)XK nuclease family transposase [bacterium]
MEDIKQENNNLDEEVILDINELKEYLKNATLFSDKFFRFFLQNKTFKPAQFLIRKFLNNDSIFVKNMEIQKDIDNIGGRGIRLDFYCEEIGDNGEVIKRFNIEIQRSSEGAIAVRARFYSSSIDSNSLKAGDKFNKLSDNYIIFITEQDIFKQNQALYKIQRYIEITDKKGNIIDLKPFNDGSYIIYINGAYKDTSSDIGKIIHDFHCVNPDEMFCDELKEPALYLKNNKGEINNMLEFLTKESRERVEKRIKEAEARGKKAGLLETAKNMILAGIPLQVISEITKLSIPELRIIEFKIQEQRRNK